MKSNQSKKILIISHSSEFIGGGERSILHLAEKLRSDNFNVSFCFPGKSSFFRMASEKNFSSYVIPYTWSVVNANTSRFKNMNEDDVQRSLADQNLHALISLVKLIKEQKIDCVITNTGTVPWGGVAAKMSGAHHCWFIREFGEEDFLFDFNMDVATRSTMINKLSDHVFFNSSSVAGKFKDFIPKEKITIVPPSFNKLSTKSRRARSPSKLSRLAVIGTIKEGKGQLEALKALNSLIDEGYNDLSLTLAGSTGSKTYLNKVKSYVKKNNLGQHVKIAGDVKDIESLYQNIDVLLVCSKKEAFGRVIVEAMLRNIPVIAQNTGGPQELISHKENGMFYDSEVDSGIEDAYKQLKSFGPETLKQMLDTANKKANELYIDQPGEKFVNTIQNVLVSSSGVPWLKYLDDIISPILDHYDSLSATHHQLISDVKNLQQANIELSKKSKPQFIGKAKNIKARFTGKKF